MINTKRMSQLDAVNAINNKDISQLLLDYANYEMKLGRNLPIIAESGFEFTWRGINCVVK